MSDPSDRSARSGKSDSSGRILLPSGGYRKLRSFQAAQLAYDATVLFCDRFIDKRSRTHDQMVQAARSGVQNIAEGSMASATSSKTELKLTGVARASLEELALDCEDYLRQHDLRLWDKNSPEALAVRNKYKEIPSDRSDSCDLLALYGLRTADPETAANTLVCLVNQASYLLGRQMQTLEQRFLKEGGVAERMYQARQTERAKGNR